MKLLKETIEKILPPDAAARAAARKRLEQLTMPYWALGRLMDLAEDLAGMTGSARVKLDRKTVVVMAADHGVSVEGISKYPQEVTVQMIRNFVQGGAGINALCRLCGARVVVVDMGVAGDVAGLVREQKILGKSIGPGTKNIARGPAMSRDEALRCVETGIEIALELSASTDIFGTGDMGIGNTTSSGAIISVLSGLPPRDIAGAGAGLEGAQLEHKIEIIERAIKLNNPDRNDPIDVLAKIGGFEIGGIAGLVLGAASVRRPILIDGFISTAGALIASRISPLSAEYMIASHRSAEKGHQAALDALGKKPLLDLGLRLGEGSGAALAMHIVEASTRVLGEIATFEEAAVTRSEA
jgi:nicotinate-nucleotide--dimethylbenzimidazole phosphoribosyltransferase